MGRDFQDGGRLGGVGECGEKDLDKPRLEGRAFLAEAGQVQRQRLWLNNRGDLVQSEHKVCSAGAGTAKEGR